MNIRELMDRDGIKLRKQSHREFSAPCPWCGGRDRFRVWPNEEGGSFWCRVCNKGGDMVKYHMLTTGMRYFDACYDLGVEPRFKPRKSSGQRFKKILSPPLLWRKNAAREIEQYHKTLFSEIGASMRSWLAERGISERSIKKTHLGLNTSDRYFYRKSWGMTEEINENTGEPKSIWLPAGLVIPYLSSNEPIRLRVRRNKSDDGNRYVTVSGSSSQPKRLGRLSRVVIVESDLDGILISQEAGDLASVVALGSASLRPDAEINYYLRAAEMILLALDYDTAGAAQTSWWQRHYGSKVRRWPVPTGKDPGEAFQAGINIRTWIEAGLKKG